MTAHARAAVQPETAEPGSREAPAGATRPRIAFLYSEPSPYIVACWRELRERHDAELLVVHWDQNPEVPFGLDLASIGRAVPRRGMSRDEIGALAERAGNYSPELVSGHEKDGLCLTTMTH